MRRRGRATSAALGRAVALACAFGLAIACSGETKAFPGALMLAIQTDLAAPKDIASVGLYITSDGRPIFADTRDVAPNGEVKFPATLAVLADADRPRAVIKIRAMAFKDTGELRVLRDIITTVPKGRTALLRAPLLWINEGSGTGNRQDLFSGTKALDVPIDGFTRVSSACPDGQTFLQGECADANVDSSTLPDYDERAVFGGGGPNGTGGRCFDVLTCFAGAAKVAVDAATCTAAGVDANDPNLSFAVSLPASAAAGECDSAGTCLVPLDKGAGWTPSAGGVAFVRALCTRITSGKALEIVRTNACPAKDLTTPSCGPASSVTRSGAPADASTEGSTAAKDFDAPLAFAEEPNLSGVAIDADSVYLARTAALPGPPGVVKLARADVTAQKPASSVAILFGYGAPQSSALVAGPQPSIQKIVARGESGEVRVCTPTSANDCPTFTVNGPPVLAIGPADAYAYGDTGGLPGLYSINLASPALTPRVVVPSVAVAALHHANGTLYLGMADGSIQKCAVPCQDVASLVPVRAAPSTPSIVTALTSDDRVANKLFFLQVPADGVTLAAGGVFSIDMAGTGEQVLATGAEVLGGGPPPLTPPAALAVDSSYVYWGGTFTDPRDSTAKRGVLRKNHLTVAASEPFLEAAQGTAFAGAIAVDGSDVFWVYDRTDGALQFARKTRSF